MNGVMLTKVRTDVDELVDQILTRVKWGDVEGWQRVPMTTGLVYRQFLGGRLLVWLDSWEVQIQDEDQRDTGYKNQLRGDAADLLENRLWGEDNLVVEGGEIGRVATAIAAEFVVEE